MIPLQPSASQDHLITTLRAERSQITPPPLYARQDTATDNTCAYVAGNGRSPLICPAPSTCSQSGSSLGCCSGIQCAPYYRTCGDNGAPYITTYGSALSCPAAAPRCVTYILFDDYTAISVFSCGTAGTTANIDTVSDGRLTDGVYRAVNINDVSATLGGKGNGVTSGVGSGSTPGAAGSGADGASPTQSSGQSSIDTTLIIAVIIPVVSVLFLWSILIFLAGRYDRERVLLFLTLGLSGCLRRPITPERRPDRNDNAPEVVHRKNEPRQSERLISNNVSNSRGQNTSFERSSEAAPIQEERDRRWTQELPASRQ